MNASEELWRQWSGQLRAFLPEVHGHRSKTLAFYVLGVVLAGSTRLPKVAEALVGVSAAKTPSSERRLARFLANQQVAVLPLWTHLLSQFLTFWRERRLVFVLDATALDERATVLYLGLLVHSRLLPVSRQVLPVHEPWEQRQWEVVGALLDRVIPLLGAAECTLLADRGLVGHPLVQLCAQRGWHYVLRLSAAHTCQPQRGRWARGWIPCRRLVPRPGRQWYGSVRLWQERPLLAQVSATWEPERKEPWIVVSDRPAGRQRVRACARMRAECASNRPFKISSAAAGQATDELRSEPSQHRERGYMTAEGGGQPPDPSGDTERKEYGVDHCADGHGSTKILRAGRAEPAHRQAAHHRGSYAKQREREDGGCQPEQQCLRGMEAQKTIAPLHHQEDERQNRPCHR
jgi:hypothetical protein